MDFITEVACSYSIGACPQEPHSSSFSKSKTDFLISTASYNNPQHKKFRDVTVAPNKDPRIEVKNFHEGYDPVQHAGLIKDSEATDEALAVQGTPATQDLSISICISLQKPACNFPRTTPSKDSKIIAMSVQNNNSEEPAARTISIKCEIDTVALLASVNEYSSILSTKAIPTAKESIKNSSASSIETQRTLSEPKVYMQKKRKYTQMLNLEDDIDELSL
ncbi:hypothetical protein ACMFMG_011995 [Clarireedia jacksonii]